MKRRKTWREKLEGVQERKIVDAPQGKMLIPRPLDVDALMRKIPRGELATVTQIRDSLAREFHADYACPMTTGIFMRIAAEAAEEDLKRGEKQVTPYWRVIRSDGSLNGRFPGGVEAQATRLREEGHVIEQGTGKAPPKVREFERSLARL